MFCPKGLKPVRRGGFRGKKVLLLLLVQEVMFGPKANIFPQRKSAEFSMTFADKKEKKA